MEEVSEPLNSTAMELDTSEVESEMFKDKSRSSINESLEAIGASPIKTHSMPKHPRLSYASQKLDRSISSFKETFTAAIGVSESDIPTEQSSLTKESVFELRKKANDLDKLTEQMKAKLSIQTITHRGKVQILTLTQESWTIAFAFNYFGVSVYAVS